MKTARNLLIAFLAGAVGAAIPLYLHLAGERDQAKAEVERLQGELAVARDNLAISDIHSRLGLLASAVRQGDYETARNQSTLLYDDATELADRLEGEEGDAMTERRLRTFIDSRDDVTAALATGDPDVLETLERLFRLLGSSLNGPAN